jgi:predicted transcriptional regulator
MTITLDLPDDLAARLATRPDVNQFAAAALADALDAEEDEGADYDLEAAVKAIRRGLAEADAGRGRPLDEFIAERMEARRQQTGGEVTQAA